MCAMQYAEHVSEFFQWGGGQLHMVLGACVRSSCVGIGCWQCCEEVLPEYIDTETAPYALNLRGAPFWAPKPLDLGQQPAT